MCGPSAPRSGAAQPPPPKAPPPAAQTAKTIKSAGTSDNRDAQRQRNARTGLQQLRVNLNVPDAGGGLGGTMGQLRVRQGG